MSDHPILKEIGLSREQVRAALGLSYARPPGVAKSYVHRELGLKSWLRYRPVVERLCQKAAAGDARALLEKPRRGFTKTAREFGLNIHSASTFYYRHFAGVPIEAAALRQFVEATDEYFERKLKGESGVENGQ